MGEILRFTKENEVYIYLILGVFAAWQIRKFILAWGELRNAAFGLERDRAQSRLNWVTTLLILSFMLGVIEFALVSFVVPTVPDAMPLLTPTLDLLASPTTTLQTPLLNTGSTQENVFDVDNNGCIPGEIEITFPKSGDTVNDIVEIRGSVDVSNFGFYKFEMASIDTLSWLTIQAGDAITREGRLGYWDTTRLSPGDYGLRLVITDNQGNSIDPCAIQVRVDPPSEE